MSAWQRIRLTRAQPPELVTADRAGVFVSALEQSEQLMRAAESVGAAARPLPLFYALSQAGRAIAAARLVGPWRLAGHGICVPPQDEPNLLHRVVTPKVEGNKALAAGRRSSFAGVAEGIGSGSLTAPVALGEVWAAIPDLIEPAPQIPGCDPGWRRPLRAYSPHWNVSDVRTNTLTNGRALELLVAGLPTGDQDNPRNPVELLEDLEIHYPTSAGVAVPGGHHGAPVYAWGPAGDRLPTFSWPEIRNLHVTEHQRRLDAIAPDYRGRGERLLVPRLGGRDALSPLMLWWALLYGLSSIARYDPELWVDALDVNRSEQAVPIEAALDVALEAFPELILSALLGFG
jgi:hypothetical protein